MIAQVSDFEFELEIPHTDTDKVEQELTVFIEKYEPKVLKMLLGNVLYADYLTNIDSDPIPDKWVSLAAQAKPVILGYVYYWYMRNTNTVTTSVGEAKGKAQNSTVVNSVEKMVSNWNQSVDAAYEFGAFIANNSLDYGQYYLSLYKFPFGGWHTRCLPEIFVKMNTLGI